MLLRSSRLDAYVIAASAVLAIGGMLTIRHGDFVGWWLLMGSSLTAALVFARPYFPQSLQAPEREALEISPWGVRRIDDAGLNEAVSWSDLTEVAVVTARDDADDEDVHIVLRGKESAAVVIPHTLAVESGVLTELQMRLSEFDNQAFIDAITSAVDSVFVLWRAPATVSPIRTGVAVYPQMRLKAAS
jgi:hypothetical protein